MTPTKPIDAAIAACRGTDGVVDARALAAALATSARATQAPSRSLAEIGRDAARKAQREALLATLEACGWNLSEAARRLRMGAAAAVIRSLRKLGLNREYADARARGDVRHGGHRASTVSPLLNSSESDTVRT